MVLFKAFGMNCTVTFATKALLLSCSGSVNNNLDLPSSSLWLWPLLSGASAELVETNQMKLSVLVSFISC